MERETVESNPVKDGGFDTASFEDKIRKTREQVVGEDHLLGKAYAEKPEAPASPLGGDFSASRELGEELGSTENRPRDELREK